MIRTFNNLTFFKRFLRKPSENVVFLRVRATGCDACQHSGYKGRTGIYELVMVDETLRQLIHDQVSEQQLTGYARRHSAGIRDDGKEKILAGVTSVQEILRITLEE